MKRKQHAATKSKGAGPAARTAADAAMTACRLHGPAWRWELAHWPDTPRTTSMHWRLFDEHVVAAHRFLTARRLAAEQVDPAAEDYPRIAAAEALERDATRLPTLKILVLADEDPAAIAARFDLQEDVITTWERLFFDVRAARRAVAWVNHHVILPELYHGDALLAAKFKLALAAGPDGAAAVLDLDERLPLTAAKHVFDRALKVELLMNALAALPLPAGSAPAAHRQATRYYLEVKKLELEKLKLVERCAKAQRQHERKLAELALATERLRARHESRSRANTDEGAVTTPVTTPVTAPATTRVEAHIAGAGSTEFASTEFASTEFASTEFASTEFASAENPPAEPPTSPAPRRRSRRRSSVAQQAEVLPSWDTQDPKSSPPGRPHESDNLVTR